jgi:hypothetical protein
MDILTQSLLITVAAIIKFFICLHLLGYDIYRKNKVEFEQQEKVDEINLLEESYAEDLQDLQNLNDQLSYQNGLKDKIKRQTEIKYSNLIHMSSAYFMSMFDDLNSEGGLSRFRTKRQVRDFIFSRIKTFVDDINSKK